MERVVIESTGNLFKFFGFLFILLYYVFIDRGLVSYRVYQFGHNFFEGFQIKKVSFLRVVSVIYTSCAFCKKRNHSIKVCTNPLKKSGLIN